MNRRNEHILFILQVKFTSELTVAFKGAFVTLKHKFGRAIVIKKKKKLEREKLCVKIDDNKFRILFFPWKTEQIHYECYHKGRI